MEKLISPRPPWVTEEQAQPVHDQDNRVTGSFSVWCTFLAHCTDTVIATRGKKLTAWLDCSHDISCYILSNTKSMASTSKNGINVSTHNNLYLGGGLVAKSCPNLVTLWTVARQAPLSMGFSRQEYWNGLLFPSPGDLSKTRDQTHFPCIGKWILHHWATWEAQSARDLLFVVLVLSEWHNDLI